jgi:hypothetical protein
MAEITIRLKRLKPVYCKTPSASAFSLLCTVLNSTRQTQMVLELIENPASMD